MNDESPDHAKADPARDDSGDYLCPHCALRVKSKTARWEHVSACPKNPNPECQWCGRHYSTRELARHAARCPMRAEPAAQDANEPDDNAPDLARPDDDLGDDADDAQQPDPDAPEPEPTMDARDALSEAVFGEPPARATTTDAETIVAVIRLWPGYFSPPAKDPDFLAGLYRAAQYLDAHDYLTTAPGEAGEAAWDRFFDALEKNLTLEEIEELSEVSSEWDPRVRALLGAALQPPPRPRVSPSQAFLMGSIGFGLGALLTHNAQQARAKRAATQAQAQATATSTPPTTRPPYNPAVHGSVDAYRAAYGDTTTTDAPVGLDTKRPQPWRPQA